MIKHTKRITVEKMRELCRLAEMRMMLSVYVNPRTHCGCIVGIMGSYSFGIREADRLRFDWQSSPDNGFERIAREWGLPVEYVIGLDQGFEAASTVSFVFNKFRENQDFRSGYMDGKRIREAMLRCLVPSVYDDHKEIPVEYQSEVLASNEETTPFAMAGVETA